MTSKVPPFLERDRIIFKMYSCEEHLKNLKNIQSRYGDLLAKSARVNAELETDSFISQLFGVFDSLFLKINDKLQLGIPADKVDIYRVLTGLSSETKGVELAHELDQVNRSGNLYWVIDQLGKYSLEGSVLSANPSKLIPGSELDYNKVIPFFEHLLREIRIFLKNIRLKSQLCFSIKRWG